MTAGEVMAPVERANRHRHVMQLDNKRRGVCKGCAALDDPLTCSHCNAKSKCSGCGTVRDYAQEEDAAGQYGRQSYRKPAAVNG